MTDVPSAAQQQSVRKLVSVLYLSGAITIVAGIALGFVISPALFAAVALGIADFVIAGLFSSGRIGPLAARRAATEAGDAAALAEADPSFNPYARED
jgi:hypothetical protein